MVLIEDGKIVIKHIAKPDKAIKWVNDNQLEDEMTNEDFLKKVDEEFKKRDIKKYGRDGIMNVWERKFTYRKLPFLVSVNRYFVLGVPLTEMRGMNKLGKWAVLEYPDEMKHIVDFLESNMDKSEWLYKDTLHTWNDNHTLKQMVNQMIDYGKHDIDWWLDKAEDELKDKNLTKLNEFNKVWGIKNVVQKT